jgi:hypothetical protein
MVERTCYRCGVAIEDGAPFCPSCGAAQIRVATEQPVPQPPPLAPVPDVSRESIATAAPVGSSVQASAPARRRSAMPIVLPLALLASAACILEPRVGWVVLLGMVVWGILRYQQRFGAMSAGIGARIGALTGFLTFAFACVLYWFGYAMRLLPFLTDADRQQIIKQIQDAAAKNPDPRAQEMIKWMATSQGLVTLLIFTLSVAFIFFLVSATATGAIAGALTKKKPQQQ